MVSSFLFPVRENESGEYTQRKLTPLPLFRPSSPMGSHNPAEGAKEKEEIRNVKKSLTAKAAQKPLYTAQFGLESMERERERERENRREEERFFLLKPTNLLFFPIFSHFSFFFGGDHKTAVSSAAVPTSSFFQVLEVSSSPPTPKKATNGAEIPISEKKGSADTL